MKSVTTHSPAVEHALTEPVARRELAAAFRLAVRLDLHEAVANHFSVRLPGSNEFLINPNQQHFARISASHLLKLNAHDNQVMQRSNAPDPTAWGLHGAIHRRCPHAVCVMHAHPRFATVLASLEDSELKPIDQNTAMFYGTHVVDQSFQGLAFAREGERCAQLLQDPELTVLVMGNHGITVVGRSVAETFHRLYYFERAAETYIRALQTGRPLRLMTHEVAKKTAIQLKNYPDACHRHFAELKALLDANGEDYQT